MSASDAKFIPGLELSRLFFAEGVAPIMAREFPGLCYATVRIGSGSGVLPEMVRFCICAAEKRGISVAGFATNPRRADLAGA